MVMVHDKIVLEPIDKNVERELEHDKNFEPELIDKYDVMVLEHDTNVELERIDKNDVKVQVHDNFVADDKREQLK